MHGTIVLALAKHKILLAMPTNKNPQHKEGPVAAAIEKQTAKLPSDFFLWLGLGAMAASAACKIMKKDHLSLFIGQWPAPFLIMGLYNKLVRLEGTDAFDHNEDVSLAASGRKLREAVGA